MTPPSSSLGVLMRIVRQPGAREVFLEPVKVNAATSGSLAPGCTGLDVLGADETHAGLLYAISDGSAAFDAHLASPHCKSFNAVLFSLVSTKVADPRP